MFPRDSQEFRDAKSSFWLTTGKYTKIEKLTNEEVNELAEYQEKIHTLNQTHEEYLEKDRIYRHSDKVKKRQAYLNSRLCYDPRFDIGGFNYFVGRYVSYGTLYSWAKWEKEQEKNPMFANITVPKFCKQYLIYDDEGNEMIFDEHMNDEYKKEYDKKRLEIQRERSRNCTKRKRQNNKNIKQQEKEKRNKFRHRVCKDPRYNKIQRDASHKPYEETTNYYTLYDWAKRRLSSENISDVEKELLKGFDKAEDFAKAYLITDKNGNFIYEEPKGIKSWKKDKIDKYDRKKYSMRSRYKLCLDPRYEKEIKVTEYTTKIWEQKICTYNSLNLWYQTNFPNEIIGDLSKKEFLNKYVLTDKQGNYIYDENEALNLLELNQLNVGIDENKSLYDTTNTLFEM